MSIFKNIDFSQAHDMVSNCILNALIHGVQDFEQVRFDYFLRAV